uniref:carbon starvation CstA family protein n=1 Tax=Bacillus altitudinis TaxID=293387 RepID=UPI0023558258
RFGVGIRIGIGMGVGVYYKKTGNLKVGRCGGLILVMLGVLVGGNIEGRGVGDLLRVDRKRVGVAVGMYGLFAGVVGVWLL